MLANPNYPYSYPVKNEYRYPYSYSFLYGLSDGCIRIRFLIIFEFDIIRNIRQNPKYLTLFVFTKVKYP
jgi:hypothetical protein